MNPSSKKPLALVTGASRGIGLQFATQFAKKGYDLIIVSEHLEIVDAALELKSYGTEVDFLQLNLAEPKNVNMLYEFIRFKLRPLDVAVLNLGTSTPGHFVKETRIKDELRLISRNIISVVCLAKFLLKDMVGRGEGHILFTSSACSSRSSFQAVYYATKSFINAFSESIKKELEETNIKVTVLESDPAVENNLSDLIIA